MRTIIITALAALLLHAPPAAAQIPNAQGTLEQVAAQYPQQFACAHTGAGCSWDWIKLAACALRSEDIRWGLNGKRGNPNDLSMDVVAWRGSGTAVDVVNGGAMEIIDVIGGAGGPSPRIVWGVAPGGPGDRGTWVDPAPFCSGTTTGGGGTGGGTKPQPQPVTVDVSQLLQRLDQVVSELRNANGQIYNLTTQQAYANERLNGIEDAARSTAAVAGNLVADGSWLAQTLEALRAVPAALNRGVKVRF